MMNKIIGPVFFLLFYVLTTVRAQQFSQDIRTNRFNSASSQGRVRFPGVTRPRTQFIPPQPQEVSRPRQPPFQPLSQQQSFSSQGGFKQQTRQPASSRPEAVNNEIFPGLTGRPPRDEVTLGTAANAAQLAVNNQNGAEGGFKPIQSSRQPQTQTQFLTSQLPNVGIPNNDLFTYADSRFVRLPADLREQRRIADEQEFKLLQGTSARFLERQLQANVATPIGFQSQGGSIHSAALTAAQPQIQPLHSAPGQQALVQPAHQAQQTYSSVSGQGVYPTAPVQPQYPVVQQPVLPQAQPAPQGVYPVTQPQPIPASYPVAQPALASGYYSLAQEQYAVAPPPVPQPVAVSPAVSPYAATPSPPVPYPAGYQTGAYQADPYAQGDFYAQSGYSNQGYSYQNYPTQPQDVSGYNYGYNVYKG